MQAWQSVFLGTRELPREISAFELEAFFTFSGAERSPLRLTEQFYRDYLEDSTIFALARRH